MEEEQKVDQTGVQSNEQPQENPERTKVVSFPPVRRKRKAKKKLLIVVVILVLGVLGITAWFIFGGEELTLSPEISPTPAEEKAVPTPTPTTKPANKEDIKIEVLNGTGIGGEAAFLQKELGELGYEDVDTGNADTKDYSTTEVTFTRSVPDEIRDEIEDKLEDLYKDMDIKTGSLEGKDIEIIVGLKKGQSFPTKAPTATAKPEVTTTLTPTPTTTPTATSSATPAP